MAVREFTDWHGDSLVVTSAPEASLGEASLDERYLVAFEAFGEPWLNEAHVRELRDYLSELLGET